MPWKAKALRTTSGPASQCLNCGGCVKTRFLYCTAAVVTMPSMSRSVSRHLCDLGAWTLRFRPRSGLSWVYQTGKPARTCFAAVTVLSMSSSLWAAETKTASYCEGARYTPCSSIPR